MQTGENDINKQRLSWLDVAKGFSIGFIVLGHTSSDFLHNFCFSFNSVIFFILAGMTFCRMINKKDELLCFDDRNATEFIKKTVKKLLFPYFIWGSISILIYYVLEGMILSHFQTGENMNFSILPNILGLLYGNSETEFFEYYRPLWFLPCLFIVEIIWFFALKVMYRVPEKTAWIFYGIFMVIFISFGMVEKAFRWNLILPFETESAIFMSFFFGIGLFLRSKGEYYYHKINHALRNKKIFGLLFIIWGIWAVCGNILNGNTNTRVDNFSNIFLYIFNALWISMGIIYISAVIRRCALLEYLGKRTMAILVLHKYPIMFFKLFSYIQTKIQEGNLLIEIFVTVLTISLCLVAERVISKFLPQLFGQNSEKIF